MSTLGDNIVPSLVTIEQNQRKEVVKRAKERDNEPTIPCAEWAENLARLHPDDLSPAEKATLAGHLSICTECRAVYAKYEQDRERISSLPADDVPADLPRKLVLMREVQQLFMNREQEAGNSPPYPTIHVKC